MTLRQLRNSLQSSKISGPDGLHTDLRPWVHGDSDFREQIAHSLQRCSVVDAVGESDPGTVGIAPTDQDDDTRAVASRPKIPKGPNAFMKPGISAHRSPSTSDQCIACVFLSFQHRSALLFMIHELPTARGDRLNMTKSSQRGFSNSITCGRGFSESTL